MKVSNLRRKLIAALAAGGMLTPSAAYAANLNTNLVLNSDFESVDAIFGVNNGLQLPNWGDGSTTGFAYAYSQAYDLGGPLAGGGNYYFTSNQSGGTGANVTAPGSVMQSIDVSTGATAAVIAAGTGGFSLSGFFTSYVTPLGVPDGDIGNIHLRFLNASNVSLGTSLLSDPVPTEGWKQASSSGAIPVGTAKVQVSLYGTSVSGGPDGYIDNLDFRVTSFLPSLSITVDRSTGSVALTNQTGAAKNISAYSITSAFEGLNPTGWLSITDNYDNGNGGPTQVDSAHAWAEQSNAVSDVTESEPTNAGASLAAGRTVNLGNSLWVTNHTEDLTFSYVSNGQTVTGLVNYTGSPRVEGDLNVDGAINAADWAILRGNQLGNLSSQALAAAYRLGDLNGDRKNDYADFVEFKALYDQANGVGAFVAMVASVPEPSTFSLVAAAGCLLGARRRHRSS
jgi:hypothetical protein